jgi:putative PIN family toxin of toxin-antitoxin system
LWIKSEPNAPRVKLLVDTNTLVSGTLWTGAPSRLIEAIEQQRANLVLSAALLAEFGDVVGRQEFASRLAARNVTPSKLVVRLARKAEFVSPKSLPVPASLRDPKDLPVLATAVAARVDAIVTGDTDLLTMRSFEGIPIITAREALEKLRLPAE